MPSTPKVTENSFSPLSLEKLRKFYIGFALKQGMSGDDAEDFSMYAISKKIELKKEEMNAGYLYFNFIEKKGFVRDQREIYAEKWDEGLLKTAKSVASESAATMRFLALIHPLEQRTRAVLFLTLFHGLTTTHVGYCLGVSSSRVSQIFSAGVKRLRDLANEEES